MGHKRCSHGKEKRSCAECNPCPHRKLERKCAECNPCPHGKLKGSCVDCNACPHGKLKTNCAKCVPCPHGKLKVDCAACNPCPHGKLKGHCAACNPCPHGKLKRHCAQCRGITHVNCNDTRFSSHFETRSVLSFQEIFTSSLGARYLSRLRLTQIKPPGPVSSPTTYGYCPASKHPNLPNYWYYPTHLLVLPARNHTQPSQALLVLPARDDVVYFQNQLHHLRGE